MKENNKSYIIKFDLLDQQIDFEGIFRPSGKEEQLSVLAKLKDMHDSVKGILRLNFRKLRYINASGVHVLSCLILYAKEKDSVSISIIASGILAWSERVLPNLLSIWEKVSFTVHDRGFYKSQGIIEDLDFIPLLRNQTRILWPIEKHVLHRHGLEKGMRVADICCGCGDVPLLISREMHPSFIMGIDHSEAAVEYARNLQSEFRIRNAEFQRGDATALMIHDNTFDFVICRLSLQIFSQPEQIVEELVRITKPGGRIYTLCEDYDLIVGYPETAAIRSTYDQAASYGESLGMDLTSGKKLFGMLERARLEDIMVDHVVIDTGNTERDAFARVIESWRTFSVYTIGESLKLSEGDQVKLLSGYEAHLRTIRDPGGYTTWSMVACSGRKPRLEEE